MIIWAWADSVSCGSVELWEKETTSPERQTWFARIAPAKIRTQTPTRSFGCRPTRFAIRRKNPYPSTEARPKGPLSEFGSCAGTKGFRAVVDETRWRGWARPDSNRRPSPCQGDVITARPRARCRGEVRDRLKGFQDAARG